MRKTNAIGNVAGFHVDKDPPGTPSGTRINARFLNDALNELLGIQEQMGVAESDGALKYVAASIIGIAKENALPIGALISMEELKAPSAFDPDDPEEYFPYLCLSDVDDSASIAEANWPKLVPWARLRRTAYKLPGAAAIDSFTVDVTGSDVEFPDTTAANALLVAIREEALFVDSEQAAPTGNPDFTNLAKTVNVAGTDFAITGINTGTRVVSVTGTPTASTQTAIFYTHRIAGSSTTARMFQATGMAVHSPGDADGVMIVGVRARGRFQDHGHDRLFYSGGEISAGISVTGGPLGACPEGGINNNFSMQGVRAGLLGAGTPRNSNETRSPAITAHLFIFGGVFKEV